MVAMTVCATSAGGAHANPPGEASLTSLPQVPFPRLIGGSSGGGHAAVGPTDGPLLALESAWALTLPVHNDSSTGGLALGARVGWAFPNGLAIHVRYDDLGVEPVFLTLPLQLATAGLRYSVPFLIPLPFAEVDAGPAFVGSDVRFGASVGLGASLPLGRYVLADLVAHNWFVPVAGTLRQTLTLGLGLAITFATPTR
jgi:hypothetical protein